MWLDHGFVRALWTNRCEIAPGIWRSNQPSPAHVEALAKMGIHTLINFRGANQWGSYVLECEACEEHGLTLLNGRLYSNTAPRREEIRAALDLIGRAEKPVLLHCKSEADRAGLASVIYLLAQGTDPEIAARQLSLKFAHLRISRTGILDAFVQAYANARRETGIGFLDWVDHGYDPEALAAEFSATRAGNRMLDWVLRRE